MDWPDITSIISAKRSNVTKLQWNIIGNRHKNPFLRYDKYNTWSLSWSLPWLVQYVTKTTDSPCIKWQWPCIIYIDAATFQLPHNYITCMPIKRSWKFAMQLSQVGPACDTVIEKSWDFVAEILRQPWEGELFFILSYLLVCHCFLTRWDVTTRGSYWNASRHPGSQRHLRGAR